MTVQSLTSRADYNGNGATTEFAVPFYFLLNTDLQVILTDDGVSPVTVTTLALGTDYTVAGVANPSGGSITATIAPTATQRLSILRSVPYTQLKHYVPNDPFPAASHEQALDKLTMEVQQLAEVQSRALTLSANTDPDTVSPVLPTPESNALIGWNQNADALQNVDPQTLATIVAYGTSNSDLFSGDGVQTSFALSANPGALNNLDVAISGVSQRPALDYTWDGGTTLTFTVAPPSGSSNVLARYMQGLPQGTLGDAEVVVHQPFTGAITRTQHDKNADTTSITDAGAQPAQTQTYNLAAVNSAVAATRYVQVPEGDYLVAAVPTNTLGTELVGPGRIRLPVSGGSRQLNLSADAGQHVFGAEYLFAFHVAIRAQGPGDSATIVCSGDSTTYGAGGNGASSPYLLSDLMLTLGAEAGYKIVAVNRGQVGQNTYHWRTTYLAGDMAAVPNLLILRWGINDPGWLKDNTTPPLDSGQDYPNRRDIGDFRDDLRAGLATIRASRSVKSLSILLMTPNCTNDTPNGRDELWYEQVRLVVRQAARDFQCAFIDTYSLWNDTRNGAADETVVDDGWMDNLMPAIPGEANRAIHPHNVMNSWIASKIAEVIYPRGLRANYFPGVLGLQPDASVPTAFKIGLNLQRTTPTGFPGVDGGVLTVRTPDDVAMQIAWDYLSGSPRPAIRFGSGASWFEWLSRQGTDPTLGAAWVPYDGTGNHNVRVTKSWGRVKISGTIKNGTVTPGTVLFTLPAGFRPIGQQWFPCTTGASMDTTAHISVLTDGRVMTQAGVLTAGLCLSSIEFEAYA